MVLAIGQGAFAIPGAEDGEDSAGQLVPRIGRKIDAQGEMEVIEDLLTQVLKLGGVNSVKIRFSPP